MSDKKYRVKIVYVKHYEAENDICEHINFESEDSARQFAQRQNKIPQVLEAKYIGIFKK